MPIGKEWADETGVCRCTFHYRPSVVRPTYAVVDLFPGVFADIVDKQSSCSILKSEPERVPKPKRPNCTVLAGGLIVKRIIRWNCPIGVDAENFSEEIRECL